ncbi:hypothetical protein SCUCBS95973_002426 [Sporothrix curviconia]|uniref:Uncharacterized protein n=1 Tax=Sporothrix curviconia TaxID=1260050 RepID=A0ABP0B6T4_9PEZI
MSSLAARRMARRPALEAKLQHMAQTLQPLVHAATGDVHPYFPLTIVQFWLLNDEKLNSLASFYHQRTPHALKNCYPCPVSWPRRGLTLEDKRRKFGRFIGLRGCETPRRSGGFSRDLERQAYMLQHGCGRNCTVAWDSYDVACLPCALRKINDILVGADAVCAPGTAQTSTWDNMDDDTATLVDMDADMMDADMLDAESEPRPLTVDDIVENAQRSRLESGAGEEAVRRKTGHF